MKKILRIVILLIIILLLFICINKIIKKEENGNLANMGLAVQKGNTIYYNKYEKGIFLVKNGEEKQLTDETAYSLNIINDQIYYMTVADFNNVMIKKVDTNGKNKKTVATIEDGTIVGGLGSKVEELIFENKLNINLEKFAYPDEFVKHGSVDEIETKYGLDVGIIVECLKAQEKNIKIVNTSC